MSTWVLIYLVSWNSAIVIFLAIQSVKAYKFFKKKKKKPKLTLIYGDKKERGPYNEGR